jgi:hypothetical protein
MSIHSRNFRAIAERRMHGHRDLHLTPDGSLMRSLKPLALVVVAGVAAFALPAPIANAGASQPASTVAGGIVDAGATQRSCKNKEEQKGCKLRRGAGYGNDKSVSFGAGADEVAPVKFRPAQVIQTYNSQRGACSDGTTYPLPYFRVVVTTKRLVVGKSYRVNESTTKTDNAFDEAGNLYDFTLTRSYEGNVKVSSARRALVDVTTTQTTKHAATPTRAARTVVCTARLKDSMKRRRDTSPLGARTG